MSKNNSSTAATAAASTTASSSRLVGNGNKNHESRGAAISPDVRPATNTMTAAATSAAAQVVSSPLQTHGSSVVIDSSSNSSAGSAAVAPSSAAAPTTTTAASHKERDENSQEEQNQQLDFIVNSHAVKSLFALPYTAADQTISVAIHNLDGTLLIDEDPELAAAEQQQSAQSPPFYPQRATTTTGSFRRRNNSRRRPRPTPPQLPRHEESGTRATGDATHDHDGGSTINAANKQGEMTTTLALLPDSEKHTTSNETALTTLVMDSLKNQSLLTQHAAQALLPVLAIAAAAPSPSLARGGDSSSGRTTTGGGPLGLPQPHDYVEPYMPSPAVEPREYLSWNFQDLNLLVGSNALVFRAPSSAAASAASPPPPQSDAAAVNHGEDKNVQNTGQAMLAVRFEDVHEMQALMERHVDVLRIQQQQQQRLLLASSPGAANKPISYAEAVLKQQQGSRTTTKDKTQDDKDEKHDGDGDLNRVHLQTCIVPVPHAPLGSLVEASLMQKHQQQHEQQPDGTGTSSDDAQQRHHPMDDRASVMLSSPAVTTVLDAYLDNIMSNVPQLALCLREKGFIQSVKLLETQDIPSRLLHPLTLDTSKPFEIVRSSSTSSSSSARNTTTNNSPRNSPSTSSLAAEMADDEVFSPQIIEMNAATLLRFLQTSCTRNNSTYLLQREKGQSKIQLYDISSISQQKQRKWIWWLAMMSYRFANRLGHITHVQGNDENQDGGCSPALLRSFRNRQRSLLQNTLDLLECLSDMDGMSHESLVAAVREQLADTFLWKDADPSHDAGPTAAADYSSTTTTTTTSSSSRPLPPPIAPATAACSLQQPYGGVTVDALNKAHDHLSAGIKYLWPILERNVLKREQQSAALKKKKEKKKKLNHNHSKQLQQQASASPSDSLLTVSEDTSSSSEEEKNDSTDDDADAAEYDFEIEAVATQLFGLHQKLVNVSLRLAEIHLKNYTSSNAMQSLRTTARRIADSLYLVGLLSSSQAEQEMGYSNQHGHQHRPGQSNMAEWICRLQLQFVWLWEHCGHFARSFAGDQLWRERGHAAADDILIVLQDAEAAIRDHQHLNTLSSKSCRRHADLPRFDNVFHLDPLFKKTAGSVTLHSLSGLVKKQRDDVTTTNDSLPTSTVSPDDVDDTAMEAALKILDQQRFLQREERKVIIAACIAYARAICAYEALRSSNDEILPSNILFDPALLGLLQQRQGDACNEAGKILLNQLRNLLTTLPADQSRDKAVSLAAESLLSSSEFWFLEGLSAFEKCHDLRNIALLRCNLCQCYKLRANAIFAPTTQKSRGTADGPTHAEYCLQEAASQLQAAHESLDQREVDPVCWDMVSTELAATFLVLGVRRRQSLIGSGNVPVFVQALRLTPGKERSIVEPMERALTIYEEAGNFQQAAAAHYQLAQFFAKIWCCQRDESKTRQKLSAAFSHYNAALSFFSNAIRGNETTFCLLCLDLSSLYSSVQGEEGLSKALLVCLDTHKAFSAEAIKAKTQTPGRYDDWFQQMETLASNVEDRVFSALRSLVKLQEDGSEAGPKRQYKDVYRAGLQAKVVAAASSSSPSVSELTSSYPAAARLIAVHDILLALQSAMNSSRTS